MTDLARHWTQCFADLDLAEPPPCAFDELVQRYCEPHRAYHTVRHLEECFAWFERAWPSMRAPGEIALALFYHDAIYDTHARDNEEQSAALAERIVHNGDVTALILATRHDAEPKAPDAKLLVDIDLAILGAETARFDEYERQIRFEYSWVEPDAFRSGRAAVLESFLDRKTIYGTEMFRAELEARARMNLARSLAALA